MRILNTDRLVGDLAGGHVTESSAAAYYLGNLILATVSTYYSLFFGFSSLGLTFFLECGAVLLITILGVAACYRANGGASGQEFMLRVNCLAFPISLKLNTVSAILGWLNYFYFFRIFDEQIFHSPDRVLNLLLFLWSPVFAGLFFWRLSVRLRSVRRLSGQKGSAAPEASAECPPSR